MLRHPTCGRGCRFQPSGSVMTEALLPKPRRAAPLSHGYVAAWMALAGLSLGYMALVATQPELVGEFTSSIRLFETASDPGAEARVQAEVRSLKLALAQAQSDIAKVKTELQGETEKAAALTSRLAAVEQQNTAKPSEMAAAAPAAEPAAPAAAAAAPEAQAPAKPEVKRIAVVPKATAPSAEAADARASAKTSASDLAEAMAAPSKGLETGSISAPASFGPAVVKPAPVEKPVGLKLANSTSVDALRLTWGLITERHGDALKSLQPRYTSGGSAAAPSYDLLAGPVKNAAEAKRLCRALAAKGVACSVGSFDGNAL